MDSTNVREVKVITAWIDVVDGCEALVCVWNDKARAYIPLFATDTEDESQMDALARNEMAKRNGDREPWRRVKFVRETPP